jgi:hypothetical protein
MTACTRGLGSSIGPAFHAHGGERETETFTALFATDPRNGAKPWALETFGEPR